MFLVGFCVAHLRFVVVFAGGVLWCLFVGLHVSSLLFSSVCVCCFFVRVLFVRCCCVLLWCVGFVLAFFSVVCALFLMCAWYIEAWYMGRRTSVS